MDHGPTLLELGVATTASTAGLISGPAQGYFSSNVLVTEGNRSLYQGVLGSAIADASGQIRVYVDDNASAGSPVELGTTGLACDKSPSGRRSGSSTCTSAAISRCRAARSSSSMLDKGTFDRVVVAGIVSIGGELTIDILDPAHLAIGDTMRVLTAADIAGSFETIDNVLFAPGKAMAITYAAAGVDLTMAFPATPTSTNR